MINFREFHNGCMCTIELFDEQDNILDIELYCQEYVSEHETHLKFRLKDTITIFDDEDLKYLEWLLGEKLKYGGDTVMEMRKYAELYDKIEKELKENTINQ